MMQTLSNQPDSEAPRPILVGGKCTCHPNDRDSFEYAGSAYCRVCNSMVHGAGETRPMTVLEKMEYDGPIDARYRLACEHCDLGIAHTTEPQDAETLEKIKGSDCPRCGEETTILDRMCHCDTPENTFEFAGVQWCEDCPGVVSNRESDYSVVAERILEEIDEYTAFSAYNLARRTGHTVLEIQKGLEELMDRGEITSTPDFEYRRSRTER